MKESDKKMLTLFIGERVHQIVENPAYYTCVCGFQAYFKKEFNVHIKEANAQLRKFTDPRDGQAVKDELVKRGLWRKFFRYARGFFDELPESIMAKYYDADFTEWLFSHDEQGDYRLCSLCAEFLKER